MGLSWLPSFLTLIELNLHFDCALFNISSCKLSYLGKSDDYPSSFTPNDYNWFKIWLGIPNLLICFLGSVLIVGEKSIFCGFPWLFDSIMITIWKSLRFLCFYWLLVLLSSLIRFFPLVESVFLGLTLLPSSFTLIKIV